MNREMKRQLQRQGEIGADGAPVAPTRQVQPRTAAGGRQNAPRKSPFVFLGEVRNELRKVSWPTAQEVKNYSIVVLATLVVLMALIFVLDFANTKASIFLFK